MTKTKKIATIAVAVVLTGTMAMGLAACKGKDKGSSKETVKPVNMSYASQTNLNVAIGYNSDSTGLFYDASVGSSTATYAGGYVAWMGREKPAAYAIEQALDIKLTDRYSGKGTGANLDTVVDNNSWGVSVDMATTDLDVAVNQAVTAGSVLNLADYLQYMPNFKAFLEDNPVVYLSLLQEGMSTTDGSGEELYVAPYFDGMDDLEKGNLMRQDWLRDVLDDDWRNTNESNNDSFEEVCYVNLDTTSTSPLTAATGTHATSFMGQTGSYSITSTAETGYTNGEKDISDGSQTITLKKDYDAALSALTGGVDSGLLTAYQAIAGSSATYSGKSGNIVDIMNAAIDAAISSNTADASSAATGENLRNLYRAYVDAAYSVNGSQYYGTASGLYPYSEIFTGYSACWDVDDLVAILRIIKCSSGQVGLTNGTKTVGIYPRSYQNDRTSDIVSLVGELYGVRGATSRYEYTYIDKEGELQDARNDTAFWEALESFGGLAEEGLVDCSYVLNRSYNAQGIDLTGLQGSADSFGEDGDTIKGEPGYGFMQWDYSQTQTKQEFDGTGDTDYDYGWVNTPVSKWADGGTDAAGETQSNTTVTINGEKYTYERFTDSWRSTKTSGLCVAASVEDDPDKLAACLAFVDYLYSNDGQITTTYGIQCQNGYGKEAYSLDMTNVPDGTWYGEEVTSITDISSYVDTVGQWVAKPEAQAAGYVVCNNQICTMDGTPATDENGDALALADYAEWKDAFGSTVKEEYQSKYFAFGGALYEGTLYKGRTTPTVTAELYGRFNDGNAPEIMAYSCRQSFTDYARKVLGSTLPICVKDQSFENQLTAEIAKVDATRVGVSIANGTISHCELDVTENMFYTCTPTGLPMSYTDNNLINDSSQDKMLWATGTSNDGSTKNYWSVMHYVIWYGYDGGTYQLNNVTLNLGSENITDAASMIGWCQSNGLTTRLNANRRGWNRAKEYWDYISKTLK